MNTKATHFRWVIVFLLFVITITNYIDRSAISYAISKMAAEFHLNDKEMGLILGAFGIGYVVTTFLGGVAADRYGARKVLFFSVIFWSLAMMLTGLATGFLLALLARTLLGIAEGPNFPAMTRSISDWLPRKERATALSYSLIAVPVALAVSGPLVSQLIIHTSWRITFFILAAFAILWAPLWWYFFRDSPSESSRVNEEEFNIIHDKNNDSTDISLTTFEKQKHSTAVFSFLLTNKTLLTNYWAFFVFGYYLFFFMTWLPSFLERNYHLSLSKVGLFTVLPWAFSALLMWIGGRISDALLTKTKNYRYARSYPLCISQFLAAICTLPIVFFHNVDWAIVFISLAVGFSMSTNAIFYAVNIDVIKTHAGTALGIMDAFFAIAGFLAPVITGWIVSLTGHFISAFLLLALLAFSSVILVLLFHKPDALSEKTNGYVSN